MLSRTYEITLANPEREFGRGEMLLLSGWPTETATAYAPTQQRRLSEAFHLISVTTRGLNQLLEMVNDLDKRVRALEARADLTARVEALESQLEKRASDSEVLEKLAAPLLELDKRVPELMTRLAALEAVGAPSGGGDVEP